MNGFISRPPRDPWKLTNYQYVENHDPRIVRRGPWHTVTPADIVSGAITAELVIAGGMSRIFAGVQTSSMTGTTEGEMK